MFVIPARAGSVGRLTLLDQNRVIRPTPRSACSPPPIRWASATQLASITARSRSIRPDGPLVIVTTLNYLAHDKEVDIILSKAKHYRTPEGKDIVNRMVRLADLTRNAFINGDLSRHEPAHRHHWAEMPTSSRISDSRSA